MARERITPEELDAAGAAAVLRIDVRKNPDDRQIPGSIRRDGTALESADNPPFTPDQRVVLYCGSGNSSSRIAAALRERGYDATALEGGYRAWIEAGLPTEPRPAPS
ncbi:MAG TPA: rhodanese-like domain-containing protein [Candidatus Tumulicola sp.]|nr:rhodanese-like domain-containing protein [Candidatus Tumulicola sp.]